MNIPYEYKNELLFITFYMIDIKISKKKEYYNYKSNFNYSITTITNSY